MQARMNHPVYLVPEAMKALHALAKSAQNAGTRPILHALVHLRASQINGCDVCIDLHGSDLKREGDTEQRIAAVANWQEASCFTEPERAALALTDAVTRLNDRADPVPDAIWEEAARHFDEQALAALLISIASINVWNRLNVATRQPVGAWKP